MAVSPLLSDPLPPSGSQTDLATIARALARDERAVEELGRRLHVVPRLVSVINAKYGRPFGPAELEDISQDALVKVWERLATYKGLGAFEAWVHRFAQHEFMNRLRLHRGRPPHHSYETESQAKEPEEGPSTRLLSAMRRLDPVDAEILQLKHDEGAMFQDIAQRMGQAISTVKSRYYRALTKLRKQLAAPFEDGTL